MAAPTPAPAAPAVYSFFGHSCSTGEERDVPPGCILVTLAECGDYSYANYGSPYNRFTTLFQDPAYQALLADPVLNKREIEHAISGRINLNYPGAPLQANRRYMDTLFSAQLHHVYPVGAIISGAPTPYPADPNQKYDIARSGLYRAGSTNHQPLLKNLDDICTNVVSDVKFMYPREILYPNQAAIENESIRLYLEGRRGIQIFESLGAHFQIRQSQLFEMFPGIHYLITCRTPCTADPAVLQSIQLRRMVSRGGFEGGYRRRPRNTRRQKRRSKGTRKSRYTRK